MYSSAHSSTNTNMVAVGPGLRQLTGASKDEYSKWQNSLRFTLNQLRVLDTEAGDKVRCSMGNPILPQNYGKKRGTVTAELLAEDPGLANAGLKVGDIVLEGSDRREFIKAVEQRDRERKTIISTILLLAKAESPLFHVLTAASRKSKDPNALLEAAELLYNSPCMATCLSIVADERCRIDKIQEDAKMSPLPAQRAIRQVGIEATAQFMSVFTADQTVTPEGKLSILELRNFCQQVIDLERALPIQNDLQSVNFINQYVRGHKGPPLDYATGDFWRDIDAHQVVFHQPRKGSPSPKTGRQQRYDGGKLSPATQGSSSITEEEARMVKSMQVLKKANPNSKRYLAAQAAIQALGFKVDDSAEPKEKGVCFRMRDTGECSYGKKCRYSHDKAKVKEAKEAKASMSVFSVPEASQDSDVALMSAARSVRRTKRTSKRRTRHPGDSSDSDDTSVASSPRMIDYLIEGDAYAELNREANERSSPSVNMMSASKKLRTKDRA